MFGSNPIEKPSMIGYRPKSTGPTRRINPIKQAGLEERISKLETELGVAYANINAMQEEIARVEKELKKKIKKVKVKQDDVYRG